VAGFAGSIGYGKKMRTFIAIDISAEIRKALAQIEAHLIYAGADVKWVRPENVHLTLKFLGEIDDKKEAEVNAALDSIAKSTKPFELSVKDLGAFPKIDHPRVIWVGLEKGAVETTALAAKVDEALASIGFAKETRPFSPHLTIGRVRSPINKDKLKEKMVSAIANIDLPTVPTHKVSSVILFQSTLTPQGSIYTKLHESVF
jgi:RNA 2',3'-cyclic 3'-phosphodiesterase